MLCSRLSPKRQITRKSVVDDRRLLAPYHCSVPSVWPDCAGRHNNGHGGVYSNHPSACDDTVTSSTATVLHSVRALRRRVSLCSVLIRPFAGVFLKACAHSTFIQLVWMDMGMDYAIVTIYQLHESYWASDYMLLLPRCGVENDALEFCCGKAVCSYCPQAS